MASSPGDWPRVFAVFEQALAVPEAERPSFVATACSSDAALRLQVEELLDSHRRADGFLSTPAFAALDDADTTRSLDGQRIGPYLIASRIGSGGMGDVYQARDTRLDRTVAIKVLPPDVADDPIARERFDREGRAIASLNHPHICALYDIGETTLPSDPATSAPPVNVRYLVMEHLEGETLAARLASGPLPIPQALHYGVQIASALDMAHRAGVVHRDVKPANVMLVKAGAKLLDFGLATRPAIFSSGGSGVTKATTPGALIGTVEYMAPEQLQGRPAGARTDVFAFGALLYEMLTGSKAFTGATPANLIAAILEHEPASVSTLQPAASPLLDRIVATCLAKDPDDRWQTARDLLRELTWVRDGAGSNGDQGHVIAVRTHRPRPAWAAVTVIAVLGLLSMYLIRRTVVTPAPRVSFSVYPADGTRFPRGSAEMAVSPDGTRLAFVALSADGVRRLWVRRFDSVDTRLLDGTGGAAAPFWSPDGRWIGFFAGQKLKRIGEGGGDPQVIAERPAGGGSGTWNRDGTILFSTWNGPILRVAETGGAATPVTTVDPARKQRNHAWPVFLPDGRRFLYVGWSTDRGENAIFQGSIDSPHTQRVIGAESSVGVAGTHLFSLSNRALIAQSFDPDYARVSGDPINVAEQISLDTPLRSGGAFSVGGNGVIAYRSASPDSHLVWFDRAGREVGAFRAPGDYHHPWLSPDETQVAVEKTDSATGRHTIWTVDLSRGTISPLVSDLTGAHTPVWSPDGRQVLFASNRFNGVDFYRMNASGGGGDELVLRFKEKLAHIPTDWSSDGRLLLFDDRSRGQTDVWILPLSDPEKARPLFESPSTEVQGQFSPDGRWIAYTSNESGPFEVYVRPFPPAEGKWRVSLSGGAQPRWRRDGKELFYLAPDGKLMAVDVKAGASTFETGTPHELFDTGIRASFIDRRNQYVVTKDGQRFLVNVSAEDESPAPITVVVGWEAARATQR